MTYFRSRSVASLAFDENRAEIQGIIVWGRIWCSWGFAFKWVAASAEALQLLYRGLTASSLFMNKKSGMKPEEWVVFVLSSALRQNASLALFYLLFPFMCSHSLSFFHLQGSAGQLNPEPPYLTNCCHGNCCSLVSLMYPPPHPLTPILQTSPNTHSWRGENNNYTPYPSLKKSKHTHSSSHWAHTLVHPFCTSTSSVKYSWCITIRGRGSALSHYLSLILTISLHFSTVILFLALSCL